MTTLDVPSTATADELRDYISNADHRISALQLRMADLRETQADLAEQKEKIELVQAARHSAIEQLQAEDGQLSLQLEDLRL